MGVIKQIDIKHRTDYFTTTLSTSNILSQNCKKSTKNHIKRSVFTILDMLQLKKLVIVKIFTV